MAPPTPWAARARTLVSILCTDAANLLKYGLDCPRRYQLAWVDPRAIELSTRYFPVRSAPYLLDGSDLDQAVVALAREHFVAGGDWDLQTAPIDCVAAISRFKMRLQSSRSWDEVGEVAWMMRNIEAHGVQDGCRTSQDVLARCQALDALRSAWAAGLVLTQKQLDARAFRERGGIGVAVGRCGEVIWMEGGSHRLALAQHMGLTKVPVCLLLVHREAVQGGRLRDTLSF